MAQHLITYLDGTRVLVRSSLADRLALEAAEHITADEIVAAPQAYGARIAHTALRRDDPATPPYKQWLETVDDLELVSPDPTRPAVPDGSAASSP